MGDADALGCWAVERSVANVDAEWVTTDNAGGLLDDSVGAAGVDWTSHAGYEPFSVSWAL